MAALALALTLTLTGQDFLIGTTPVLTSALLIQ